VADGSLELQGAVVARLKAYPAVAALVGLRVYDHIPDNPAFPYISIGPVTEVDDSADCIIGSEVTFQIDAWSREPGFVQARRIANAVRAALHGQEFNLPTNALASFEFTYRRDFRDPDGLTSHSVIVFTASIEASLST